MILELIFKVLAGGAVSGAQVSDIRHVVEDFLRVNREFTQVIQFPAHPLGVVPLREKGRIVVRGATVGVVPGHDAAHVIHYRVGADGRGLGAGSVGVGYVVNIAIGVIAPAVIGAANGVALNLLTILDDHGTGAGRQVSAHVCAISVQ